MTPRRNADSPRAAAGAAPAASRRSQRTRGVAPPTLFVLRLIAFWSAGFLLLAMVPALERAVIGATLATLFPALALLIPGATRAGDQLSAAGASIQIVSECTSLTATVLLGGAIGAFPAAPSARLAGLIVGSLILWVYNIARIIALIAVLAWFPSRFDLVHVFLWQSATIVVVAALFVAWVRLSAARTAA